MRDIIQSGTLGEITSVDFSWMLDTKHGADYFRRWHREKDKSGGLLIHKSSHHFDLVNWWLASAPHRVYASGGLRFYGLENATARGQSPRPERGTHDGERDAFELDLRVDPRLKALYLDAEHHDGYRRDRDVFGPGITIEDNLAVIVDYESGATLSYALNAHSPWEGYRVAVNGTLGRAELEVVERGAVSPGTAAASVDPSAAEVRAETSPPAALRPSGQRLLVQTHWQEARAVPIPTGRGKHGGGDELMFSDILRGVGEDSLARAADWRDGVRSIAVGIAGNRSLETDLPIYVSELGIAMLEEHRPAFDS